MQLNNLELFKNKIASGVPALGACVTLSDSAVTEIVADAGFDFCWIDCEHGIIDRHPLQEHVMALRGTNCAPLIRVPDASHSEIKKVIDLAPAGIIVPMVNDAETAHRVVSACRYPLTGTRGCGFRRGIRYGADPLKNYFAVSEHDPLVILQIEHIDAVHALDEILQVPGVDSICIGPCDLSASIGKTACFDDPELNGIFDFICRKTLETKLLLGVFCGENFRQWKARGAHYFSLVNDYEAMFRHFRGLISQCGETCPPRAIAAANEIGDDDEMSGMIDGIAIGDDAGAIRVGARR